MSLFAFSDPENCPFGDLLKPSQKHKVRSFLFIISVLSLNLTRNFHINISQSKQMNYRSSHQTSFHY